MLKNFSVPNDNVSNCKDILGKQYARLFYNCPQSHVSRDDAMGWVHVLATSGSLTFNIFPPIYFVDVCERQCWNQRM